MQEGFCGATLKERIWLAVYIDMKPILTAVFLMLCLRLQAQDVLVTGFRKMSPAGVDREVRSAVPDPDGMPCAVLKLETPLSGWTFEAGLAGIMDVRYEKGTVWLYVPASARTLSVAHPEYGVLRAWPFPESLEPGGFYAMKLERGRRPAPPEKTYAAKRPASSPSSATTNQAARQPAVQAAKPVAVKKVPKEPKFASHFIDLYGGVQLYGNSGEAGLEDVWVGLNYTWMGKRVGPYVSVGGSANREWEILGGAAVRLTDPGRTALDLHLYGGLGYVESGLGFDLGTRFAWRGTCSISKWDFAVGCQYHDRRFTPTISVGSYIWGIPVCLTLCFVGCVVL